MTCNSRRSIERLPPDVTSKLRSCVSITSVSQCVEELVLNSVDACAKNVAVRLDLAYFKIQVVDNGIGISKEELEVIGERYHTSKCHSIGDLKSLRFNGFRGEALASLRDMCAVFEITSRTQDSRTYFKAFHHGTGTSVCSTVDERPSVGTTVTILDFMCNLPVRRKGICTFRDFEFTRRALECIALVNPSVSFSLRNDQTGETCLHTRRTTSMISSFRYLFECDKVLKDITHHVPGLKVQGIMSPDGHTTNDLQFIYVNCRLVLKTRIHEVVRSVLTKYLNSKNRESASPGVPTSPRKLLGHPIFALNILCPCHSYDICFEPRKTLIEFEDWDVVTSTIKDVLGSFLQSEGYVFESYEKYLKTNLEESQRESPEKGNKVIDITNSRNALFSLVIKRPRAKAEVKNKNQEEEVEECSGLKQRNECPPRDEQNCEHIVYFNHKEQQQQNDPSTEKCNSDGKTQDDVTLSQQSQDRFRLSYNDSFKLKSSHSSSTENRTKQPVPLPVTLRFKTGPSPLSLLRSRKRKEASLKELKDAFQYEKLTKLRNGGRHNAKNGTVGRDLRNESHKKCSSSAGNSRRRTKNTSEMEENKQQEPKKKNSVPESNALCDITVSGWEAPNTHTHTDDKWSSESQEIIHETEPFIVTQPFSVPLEIESDPNMNTKPSSVDQDFLPFLLSAQASSSDTNLTKSCSSHIPAGQSQPVTSSPNLSSISVTSGFLDSAQAPSSDSKLTKPDNRTFPHTSASDVIPNWNSSSSASSHIPAGQPQPVQSSSNLSSISVTSGFLNFAISNVRSDLNDSKDVSHSISTSFPSCTNSKLHKDKREEQNWIQWQDQDSGKILYINKFTGNSSYVPPPPPLPTSSFQLQKKDIVDGHFFLSHNSTPFLPRLDRNLVDCEEDTLASKDLTDMLDIWQNPVFKRSNFKEISNAACSMSKPFVRVYNIVQNYKFSKSMFSKAEVLGQVDCKFIACLVPSNPDEDNGANLLVLFDQHAVHERIRLEHFTKELHTDEGNVQTCVLQPPLSLEMAPEYARLAHAYSSQLEKTTGLAIELERNPCSVALKTVPVCLTEREASELKNYRPSVLATLAKCLLEEQLEKIKGTSSLVGAVPKTLHTVLSSRACKGAIKFGDLLKMEDCCQLVKYLSSCQLPFQCAHGRPSVIPVLDMAHLKKPPHWKVPRPKLFRLSGVKCKMDM